MGSAEEDQKIDAFIGVTNSNRMAGASFGAPDYHDSPLLTVTARTLTLRFVRLAAIRYLQKADWSVDEAVDAFMRSAEQAGGSGAAGPSTVRPAGAPSKKRQPPRSGVATLGQYRNGGEDDSDEDNEDNEYYTGGEKSGQVVRGGDGRRGGLDNVFDRARRAGAEVGQASDLGDSSRGFQSFTGRGQTLSGIPTSGVPPDEPNDPNKPLIITVAFYENGVFTVDDGEPRKVDDPENREFMMAIMTGQCPAELLPDDPQQAIDINMVRKPGDYEPPKYRAFKGAAHKLTTTEKNNPVDKTDRDPAEGADDGGDGGDGSTQRWTGPDESKPTTSIQIRLADGSRLVAKFNLDQNVGDIRNFIRTCRPDLGNGFSLATTFPTKALTDAGQTIEAAGLAGAVVVQK